jgi:hypothetical protein
MSETPCVTTVGFSTDDLPNAHPSIGGCANGRLDCMVLKYDSRCELDARCPSQLVAPSRFIPSSLHEFNQAMLIRRYRD